MFRINFNEKRTASGQEFLFKDIFRGFQDSVGVLADFLSKFEVPNIPVLNVIPKANACSVHPESYHIPEHLSRGFLTLQHRYVPLAAFPEVPTISRPGRKIKVDRHSSRLRPYSTEIDNQKQLTNRPDISVISLPIPLDNLTEVCYITDGGEGPVLALNGTWGTSNRNGRANLIRGERNPEKWS